VAVTRSSPKRLRVLAGFVAATVVAFVAATVIESILQPGSADASRPVSELAIGPAGSFVTGAFILVGLGLVALAWALHEAVVPGKGKRRACRLLVLAGLEIAGLGVFPTDTTPVPSTPTGWVHFGLAGSAFVVLMVAFLMFARAFRDDPRWSKVATATTGLAWLTVAAFLLHLVPVVGPPAFAASEGMLERLLIAAFLLWVVVSTNHLRLVAKTWNPPTPVAVP
jgi:hypothetical membrane protein